MQQNEDCYKREFRLCVAKEWTEEVDEIVADLIDKKKKKRKNVLHKKVKKFVL